MSFSETSDQQTSLEERRTDLSRLEPTVSSGSNETGLPSLSDAGVKDLPMISSQTQIIEDEEREAEESSSSRVGSSCQESQDSNDVTGVSLSEPGAAESIKVELPPLNIEHQGEKIGASGELEVDLPPLAKCDPHQIEVKEPMAGRLSPRNRDSDSEPPCKKVSEETVETEHSSAVKSDSDSPVIHIPHSSQSNIAKSSAVTTSKDQMDVDNPAQASGSKTEPSSEHSHGNSTTKTDVNSSSNSQPAASTSSSMTDGATGSSTHSDGVYHVKWINFKKKQVPIVTQNENGPCPLLAIMNILLLQNRVKLTRNIELITVDELMDHLGYCVLGNVPSNEAVAESSRLNFEQNMQDAITVMHKLQTGLDVNVKFTGVRDFEYTPECIIFDLLKIFLYHGWLVDPQNAAEVNAVGKSSYNQLVEKIISQKTSEKPDLVSEALVAEQFLEGSASQITYHGLCELVHTVKEDELCVLFRNNHFITLYKHRNELFQLVTDQGFLTESKVVWETLSNVEGDSHFVDSEFHTYTKPEPLSQPIVKQSNLYTDEQIDQDYLVALSLQQEQQQSTGMTPDQLAWGQMDAQQQPRISDLELARSLQEEERRAAEAEAASRAQQPSQNPWPGTRAENYGGQRRPYREREMREREEKKSDCCIL